MKPITTDWKMQVPNKNDIAKMWLELEVEVVDKEFEFIQLLKENLGGELYFKGFKFGENAIFDWYCSRGRLNEIQFEEKFLLSDTVLKTFTVIEGDYVVEERAYGIGKQPKLDWKSEFVIDGEFAALLFHGGAYGSKYKKTPKEIKDKAQQFCQVLFKEKYTYEAVRFYTSDSAWNCWFIDFIIDKTYWLFCMETRLLWMLAFTDTD